MNLKVQDNLYLIFYYDSQWFESVLHLQTANLNINILTVKTAASTTVNSKEMKRERNSPDSLIKSLNFVGCWGRRNFLSFVEYRQWPIHSELGPLVNSAYDTEVLSVFAYTCEDADIS